MAKFDVSCIGFTILDILAQPVTGIPSGGGSTNAEKIDMTVAGTAGATAVDCAILGLNTQIVTSVGTDSTGDFMVSKLEGYGIDCGMISRDAKTQTCAAILLVRPNGERPAIYVPGTAETFTIQPRDIDAALNAEIIHIGGTALLPSFEGADALTILKRARDLGKTTTFDLIQADDQVAGNVVRYLPYIDYFVPSIEDAAQIAGSTAPADVAQFFKHRGAKNVILTLEGEGAYVDPHGGAPFRLPSHLIDVVDTTGCGDSFTAGIISGLSRGWDIETSAKFANTVAAKVALGLGSVGALTSFDNTIHAMNTWPLRSADLK